MRGSRRPCFSSTSARIDCGVIWPRPLDVELTLILCLRCAGIVTLTVDPAAGVNPQPINIGYLTRIDVSNPPRTQNPHTNLCTKISLVPTIMNHSRSLGTDTQSAFCSPFPLGKGARGIGRRERFFLVSPSPSRGRGQGLGSPLGSISRTPHRCS